MQRGLGVVNCMSAMSNRVTAQSLRGHVNLMCTGKITDFSQKQLLFANFLHPPPMVPIPLNFPGQSLPSEAASLPASAAPG